MRGAIWARRVDKTRSDGRAARSGDPTRCRRGRRETTEQPERRQVGGQEGRANDEECEERYGLAESTRRAQTTAPLAPATPRDAGAAGGRRPSSRKEGKLAGKRDERMMKNARSDMGSPSRQDALRRPRRSLRRPHAMPARPAGDDRAAGKKASWR